MEELDLVRYLFVDLETGSLTTEGPILEIGMRCTWGTTDRSPQDLSIVVKPTAEQWAMCNEHALAVNQFTWEEVQASGVPLDEASRRISKWLIAHNITNQTVTWVGQNCPFDLKFMEHYMGPYLEFVGLLPIETIDVMELARQLKKLDETFTPKSLKGSAISQALRLSPEGTLHRAMGGVQAAYQNFFELRRRIDALTVPAKPSKMSWKTGDLNY